jgi:hypothetical protein
MRFIKRMLMGIGATALVGLLATLVAPKAVHGAVAALVQVANTTAAPAVTLDISKSASQNVNLVCDKNQCLATASSAPYVVPPGQNLVVTSVEVIVLTGSGSNGTSPQLFQLTAGVASESYQGAEFFVLPDQVTHQFLIPSGIVFPAGMTLDSTHVVTSDIAAVGWAHGFLSPI